MVRWIVDLCCVQDSGAGSRPGGALHAVLQPVAWISRDALEDSLPCCISWLSREPYDLLVVSCNRQAVWLVCTSLLQTTVCLPCQVEWCSYPVCAVARWAAGMALWQSAGCCHLLREATSLGQLPRAAAGPACTAWRCCATFRRTMAPSGALHGCHLRCVGQILQ